MPDFGTVLVPLGVLAIGAAWAFVVLVAWLGRVESEPCPRCGRANAMKLASRKRRRVGDRKAWGRQGRTDYVLGQAGGATVSGMVFSSERVPVRVVTYKVPVVCRFCGFRDVDTLRRTYEDCRRD